MSLSSHGNALPEGYRLHWYRVGRVLGQGGFGITYEAFDTNLEKPVAIKEYLPKEFAVREQNSTVRPFTEDRKAMFNWGLERFLQEARTLAKFHHPNIVLVHNVFEANGTAYMVMEYEQGESLDRLLKMGRIENEKELLRLSHSLLDGLEHMHDAGFIHRDIKPANIYVRLDGSPVLIDFGSARFAIGGETKTLTSLITPGFAPFEQYNPEGTKQGPWTDIYGLGATLYAGMNRGRGPMEAIIRGHARIEGKPDPMESATELGKGRYSEAFLKAIDAALGFTPKERPQTVAKWRALFPSLEKQPPTPETKPQSQEDITTVIHKKAQILTGQRRGLVKWLMISLVVAIIASGVYVIETRQPSKAPTTEQPQTIDAQRQKREQDAKQIALDAEAKRKQEEFARLAHEAKIRKQQAEQQRLDQLKREKELQADAQRKQQQEEQARLAQEAKIRKQQEEQERIEQLRHEEERKKQAEIIAQQKREKEKRDRQISLLLAKGKAAISTQKLSKPVGNNALEYFQSVLQIDSNNLDAQQGVKDVIKGYISLAEKAIERNDFDKAAAYLQTAETIDPDSKAIDTAKRSVEDQRLDYVEAERVKREELQKEKAAAQLAETRKRQEIEKLLSQAEKDIASGRLSTPPDRNALDRYRLVLELDPDNRAALQGTEKIKQREKSKKKKYDYTVKASKKDRHSIVIVGYGNPDHFAGHGADFNSGDVITSFKKVIDKIMKGESVDIYTVDGKYELYLDDERHRNNNALCSRFGANKVFTGLISRKHPGIDDIDMYLYDCINQGETKETSTGGFMRIKDDPVRYFNTKPIFQRLKKYAAAGTEQLTKEREVTKRPVAEQKTVGLIVLAAGRRVGYGPSGLAGGDVIKNLVKTLRPVIPEDIYSILHSEFVSLDWYKKETRRKGYRALCNKHGANQIIFSILDGEETEITISFYKCQSQEEIVERSFSLPSQIESELMKFIKKHQLFQ